MAINQNPIDRAFERCRLLSSIVEEEYRRARGNPTDSRYVNFGITQQGGRKREEAEQQIREAFTDLVALVEHLTILDMAAAFERHFNARVSTAVGAARKTLRARTVSPRSR
jgi:hypothetical protein